jgi:predicted DNA-binding transcriptional regulator AlpA
MTMANMTRPTSEFLAGGFGDDFDVSAYTGLSRSYIRRLRLSGDGPRYAKLGRKVRHRKEWWDEWVATHVRRSTSEYAA